MTDFPASDAAARKSTGKSWEEWCGILDQAGAAAWEHRAIAQWIQQHHPEVSAWWAQNLTVGYERARGLRAVNEKSDGFAAGKSRTFRASLDRLYQAWADDEARAAWLGEAEHEVRGGTRRRSLNLDWGADGSRVRAWFSQVGEDRSRVSVQHEKLPDAAAVEAAKGFWSAALDRLQGRLGPRDSG